MPLVMVFAAVVIRVSFRFTVDVDKELQVSHHRPGASSFG
jgi:hypothetical protein